MTTAFLSWACDRLWPTLDGDEECRLRREKEKLAEEADLIEQAVDRLGSDESKLKDHLASCEKLLESEGTRKAGIDARLLNTAGLVSIAGSVVLGTLFSLATEKLASLSASPRIALAVGCLYLAAQLTAALHASVKGLQARGYDEDRPHELLSEKGVKPTVHLRSRIRKLLVRVAEHRQANDAKLSQLNLAHAALTNFLWGLFAVALIAFVASTAMSPKSTTPPPVASSASAPVTGAATVPTEGEPTGANLASSVLLISAGTCLSLVGGSWLFLWRSPRQRIAAAAVTISGLALTLMGSGKLDATLFKVDKLIGELRLDFSLGSKQHQQQALVRRMLTIGPFPDGSHQLDEEGVLRCVSSALERFDKKSIGGWKVVGRVDKRPLLPGPAKVYGSNQGLAMARANWVILKALASQPSFDLAHAVVSVGGAREIGAAVAVEELQLDRAVDVFVVLNLKGGSQGVADLPKPVACPGAANPLSR